MCENPDIMNKTALQRLEHKLLIEYQRREGRLEVDERNAYIKGKAISKEAWRLQALEMGLPPDMYLEIAALAKSETGIHPVQYGNQTFLVEVEGIVQSKYGLHREIKSIMLSQG